MKIGQWKECATKTRKWVRGLSPSIIIKSLTCGSIHSTRCGLRTVEPLPVPTRMVMQKNTWLHCACEGRGGYSRATGICWCNRTSRWERFEARVHSDDLAMLLPHTSPKERRRRVEAERARFRPLEAPCSAKRSKNGAQCIGNLCFKAFSNIGRNQEFGRIITPRSIIKSGISWL